jgi:hypothetical protein
VLLGRGEQDEAGKDDAADPDEGGHQVDPEVEDLEELTRRNHLNLL